MKFVRYVISYEKVDTRERVFFEIRRPTHRSFGTESENLVAFFETEELASHYVDKLPGSSKPQIWAVIRDKETEGVLVVEES